MEKVRKGSGCRIWLVSEGFPPSHLAGASARREVNCGPFLITGFYNND